MTPAGHRDEGGFSLIELLVVVTILAIVGSAIMTVVLTTSRAERTSRHLSTVMDDGRLSVQRITKELRAARRVYNGSDGTSMRFWVDQDQDSFEDPDEQRCYKVRPLLDASGNPIPQKFALEGWNQAITAADCTNGPPAGVTPRVVAKTLVNSAAPTTAPTVFVAYTPPPPAAAEAPQTKAVTLRLELDASPAQPSVVTFTMEVRLRNVA